MPSPRSSYTTPGDAEGRHMSGSDTEVPAGEGVAVSEEKPDVEQQSAAQAHQDQHQDQSDAPDGGLAAWLVVLGCWCVGFCSFGWLNSVGTFQAYFQTGPLRDYSPSTVAWIPSLQIFFMMAMGPIVGKLFDAYGPRYLLLGGTLLHVLGLMMASLSTQYYQILLSQGVCSAIGVSAIFQPALGCMPGWFSKRRGMAYGIMATGSSIGGVVFPIMISRLIRSVGYGWAMRAAAFLILALLAVANATIRAYVSPARGHDKSGAQGAQKAAPSRPFSEPPFAWLSLGMFLLTFGIYVPITFLPSQAMAAGMSPDLAQYLVAMFNAASLFGRLSSGALADRLGRYNVFCVSCYAAAALVVALWIPAARLTDAALVSRLVIAFAVLFGFFSGAYVSLIGALIAAISPLREIGLRTGLVFLVGSLPGLTTAPIAGAILDRSGGDWVGLMIFGGVFCFAGTTCIFAARVAKVGWKLTTIF